MKYVGVLHFKRLPPILKDKRIAARYSQQRLGDAIGVTKQHISLLEGGWANPSRKCLFKLAEVLNCPVEKLLGIEDE